MSSSMKWRQRVEGLLEVGPSRHNFSTIQSSAHLLPVMDAMGLPGPNQVIGNVVFKDCVCNLVCNLAIPIGHIKQYPTSTK